MFSCFLVSSNCISMTLINCVSVWVRFHNSKRYIKLLSVEICLARGEAKVQEVELQSRRSVSLKLYTAVHLRRRCTISPSPHSLADPLLRQVKHSSREGTSAPFCTHPCWTAAATHFSPEETHKTEAHAPHWLLSDLLKSTNPYVSYRDLPL